MGQLCKMGSFRMFYGVSYNLWTECNGDSPVKFLLGLYIYIYMLYEDPTWSLVEQRKEATFTCHIMYLVAFWHFCTSLILLACSFIVGCTNLITHALLCPIPHKLNAPIQWVMSNNQHAQADYPVHYSLRIAHGCLNKITTSSRFVKFSNRFLLIFWEWLFYIKLVLWYFENHRSWFQPPLMAQHLFTLHSTFLQNRHNKNTCKEVRNSQSAQHGHGMQTLLLCLVQILSFLPCWCQ
jgi:hypothetical protein